MEHERVEGLKENKITKKHPNSIDFVWKLWHVYIDYNVGKVILRKRRYATFAKG